MDAPDNSATIDLLRDYSRGEITAIDLRTRLDGATFGEVLMLLGEYDIPLPTAPREDREDRLELARSWLFPRSDAG
jgi:hypothetical protein